MNIVFQQLNVGCILDIVQKMIFLWSKLFPLLAGMLFGKVSYALDSFSAACRNRFSSCTISSAGLDFGCLQIFYRTLCQGIEGSNGIHLRVEEFDTVWVFGISRKNIYNTARML